MSEASIQNNIFAKFAPCSKLQELYVALMHGSRSKRRQLQVCKDVLAPREGRQGNFWQLRPLSSWLANVIHI